MADAVATQLIPPLLLLLGAWAIGALLERRHQASLRARETSPGRPPAVTLRTPPEGWVIEGAGMVTGNVVVSIDYFKRFVAGIRRVFGGRIPGYESLLERGRREALLRLEEQALAAGYHAVVGVRLETAKLANGTRTGEGTAGVEVLAYGTGLVLRRPW